MKVQLHRKPKENFDVQRIWQAAHPHPEAAHCYAFYAVALHLSELIHLCRTPDRLIGAAETAPPDWSGAVCLGAVCGRPSRFSHRGERRR